MFRLFSCSLAWGIFLITCSAQPGGDVKKGSKVFADNCAECHNTDNKDRKNGPGLQGVKDGKLPDGRKATHDEVLDVIDSGPGDMPSFKNQLTNQEKEDLIAYILTL